MDSFTLSVVGRVSNPVGAISLRPLAEPEITRTQSPHYLNKYIYILYNLKILSRFLRKFLKKTGICSHEKQKPRLCRRWDKVKTCIAGGINPENITSPLAA